MRLLFITFAILVPTAASADQTREREAVLSAARVVVDNFNHGELVERLAERSFIRILAEGRVPPDQGEAISLRLFGLIRERIQSREFLERLVARWLTETFTAPELNQLVEFAQTSAGRKTLPMFSSHPRFVSLVWREIESDVTAALYDGRMPDFVQESYAKRTAADMRSLATAVEAYAIDHSEYPDAKDITELATHISPTYIRRVPEKDAWGNPFRYMVTPDLKQYRIISGGSDGVVDAESESPAPFGSSRREPNIADNLAADIIYQNGEFIQAPDYIVERMPRPLPPGVYRVGGSVRAPRVIRRVDPQYSQEAPARVQGIVIVEALIDEAGVVKDVRILKGLPYGLDQAAVDAVRQWQFAPATKEGQSVPVLFNLTVNFNLADPAPR